MLVAIFGIVLLFQGVYGGIGGRDLKLDFQDSIISRIRRYAKPPSIPTAPLDVNDNVHHTLDEVSSILGTVGGAGSKALYGLTGISDSDCAVEIKDEDFTTISCAQFINKVSQCVSMEHLKPLLQEARRKYQKNPKARGPCFAKSKKSKKHG